MPYEIRKLPDKEKWRVYNKDTGRIASKATTKSKAEAQRRLLYMIERKEAQSVGGRLIEKIKALDKACWEGYEAIGMKTKGSRKVPNCVPIKGGVLGMTDANGNPLPLDLQYKNDRINALNFSYNMLREQLIHLIEVQQNQDAIQELEDIRDGMGNLSTAMVRLEDNREGMPMADFKREVNRLTAILTRYVREANRWEGEPRPEYGDSDVEGFGMCGGRIYQNGWVFIPMRQEIEGAGGGSSKVEPLAYYEQEGLARIRAERRERERREMEEREAKRMADARAERTAREEAIKKKRQDALEKARAEKKRKEDALRLARQDSSKSVSSGTEED